MKEGLDCLLYAHGDGTVFTKDTLRQWSLISAVFRFCMQVVLGGGQEAMEVTTTTTKAGKFDARFYHLVYEEEIGRVKGHFGPINSLAFHPNGKR